MPPSTRKDALTDVLNNVQSALDKSRGLLDLAPIPGLSSTIDILLDILDHVKVRLRTHFNGQRMR